MSAARKLEDEVFERITDDRIVEWCKEAAEQTLGSLFAITPTLKEVQREKVVRSKQEISGVMGFIRRDLEGTLSLCFPQATIVPLMSKFYGRELTGLGEQTVGGVGEMTNMIFGLVKERYNRGGVFFQMCLPVVVVGHNHSIVATLASEHIRICFETEYGPFAIEFTALKKSQA